MTDLTHTVLDGFGIVGFDDVECEYTGRNTIGVTYRKGGPAGTILAVLALSYDGAGNVTRVTRKQ